MIKEKSGQLFVISAPSGTGKTSLVKALTNKEENICLSISTTTRSPRNGEVDGVDYFFVEKTEFEKIKKNEGFLEWAEVYGNLYGTTIDLINKNIKLGKKIILEIDWQGAMQIKSKFSGKNILSLIFIKPPSLDELYSRLKKRGQDSEKTINERLALASEEIKQSKNFDYVIINDDFEVALNELYSIIKNS